MPRSRNPVSASKSAAAKRRAKRKTNAKQGKNDKWEVELIRQLGTRALPAPNREYKFDPDRRWRFDLAWPATKLAVEIEGGIYMGGRHVTPIGFTKDCEKYNAAQEQGWVVLRYVPEHIKSGYAATQTEAVHSIMATMKIVVAYGEEVLFGTGPAEEAKGILDGIFGAKREAAKLAGLLVNGLNKHKRNANNAGEYDSDRDRAPHVALGTEQKPARKKGRNKSTEDALNL